MIAPFYMCSFTCVRRADRLFGDGIQAHGRAQVFDGKLPVTNTPDDDDD